MKRNLNVESVTEEAANTSTTVFNSSDEETLPSNSSVIACTLADKYFNLPIPDLSPSQKLESLSSLSLPALPEFSSPISAKTVSESESTYEELDV